MKFKVAGLSLALALGLLNAGSVSLASTITVKGSGTLTFVSSSFTFDGGPAIQLTGSGKDNLGGQYTFQGVSEFGATVISCMAPDGTTGLQFDLVSSATIINYNSGQLFGSTGASSSNHECISESSESFGGTVTYGASGGTGKFAAATGNFTETFAGHFVAVGATGATFGAEQITTTGSVTK